MSAGIAYWKEALSYALDAAGAPGALTDQQMTAAAEELNGWGENEGMASGPVADPRDREIEALEARHAREVAGLRAEIESYRRSVAQRRNVNEGAVYVKDGIVLYDPADR